ncbi:hypothetical protein [Paracoccus mutanolyticus]|uniref:hypothetical protein n=1 Tax=Paracoccus mutanolyticus TaxID=1499308 RepID=UPI001CB89DE2|nr:hypothetical protein [Paracoccus mutanolyticus]
MANVKIDKVFKRYGAVQVCTEAVGGDHPAFRALCSMVMFVAEVVPWTMVSTSDGSIPAWSQMPPPPGHQQYRLVLPDRRQYSYPTTLNPHTNSNTSPPPTSTPILAT